MMASAPKTTIGTMGCLCCGREIPVKQTDNGTLSHPCTWCDYPGYAKAGTEAHRLVLAKVKRTAEPAPAPAPKPAPKPAPATTPAPAPAPRPRSSIFDVGA